MKSLVIYSSQTGNTRKLAEAVYDVLTGEKEIYPTSEAPEPSGYDFIAAGFWLKAGKPDPETSSYLPRIKGQPLFLFATHGAAAASQHAVDAMAAAKELAGAAKIMGTFNCPGAVDPKLIEKAGAKPQPPVWLADAPAAAGHPDAADIAALKERLKTILQQQRGEERKKIMKIAISSTGRDLDAQVDARFGRCPFFIVVDPATEGFEVLENTAAGNTGGAGVQAAQIVANAGVKVVLTGSLGPNAAEVLAAAGVKVHTGTSGSVRAVLQQHQHGELQAGADPAPSPPAAPAGAGSAALTGAGRGGGMGRGGGRGMGRGGGRRGGGGFGAGPGGDCVCPACGERAPHSPGKPCFEAHCPKCGAAMIRP